MRGSLVALMLGNDSDIDTVPYPKTRALSSRSSNVEPPLPGTQKREPGSPF